MRPGFRTSGWLVGIALIGDACVPTAAAHDALHVVDVVVDCSVARIAGTLVVPDPSVPAPCVVLMGGSLSHDRDGRMSRQGVPERTALRQLAESLAVAGYGSFRYDRVGHGGSRPGGKWTNSYHDEAAVAAAAVSWVRQQKGVGQVVAVGESAGAYLACLAAKQGTVADAYVFLGALCGSSEEMYAHAFGSLVAFANQGPTQLAWARQHARHDLALGRTYKDLLAAAAAGKSEFTITDGDFHATIGGLHRRREELRDPPDALFRYICRPALLLQGEYDLNVPPSHAARAEKVIRESGNQRVKSLVIPGVDHSFQQSPADADERIRQRYTFASFRQPYSPRLYGELLLWLTKTVPTMAHGASPETVFKLVRAPSVARGSIQGPSGPNAATIPGREIDARAKTAPETDAKTDTTPRRHVLAPGIEIIDDITDTLHTAGVDTLEGRIGPLLLAQGCQAHFIDMPAGMYVGEHPHSTESIIYTVRGQWVLCSGGRRHAMKPGSLFRFTANTPTGFEVPFAENAFILIFKGDRTTKVEREFIDYLRGMAQRLQIEHRGGTPYLLKELPRDHPARQFAAQVNPRFESR